MRVFVIHHNQVHDMPDMFVRSVDEIPDAIRQMVMMDTPDFSEEDITGDSVTITLQTITEEEAAALPDWEY